MKKCELHTLERGEFFMLDGEIHLVLDTLDESGTVECFDFHTNEVYEWSANLIVTPVWVDLNWSFKP